MKLLVKPEHFELGRLKSSKGKTLYSESCAMAQALKEAFPGALASAGSSTAVLFNEGQNYLMNFVFSEEAAKIVRAFDDHRPLMEEVEVDIYPVNKFEVVRHMWDES